MMVLVPTAHVVAGLRLKLSAIKRITTPDNENRRFMTLPPEEVYGNRVSVSNITNGGECIVNP